MQNQVAKVCVARQKPQCGLLCKREVVKRLVVLEIVNRASWEHLLPAVFRYTSLAVRSARRLRYGLFCSHDVHSLVSLTVGANK